MQRETVILEKDQVLKVQGPASITLESGSVRIFGYNAKPPFKHIIPNYRSLAIVANEKSSIKLVTGEQGKYEIRENDTIKTWEEEIKNILSLKKPLVIISIGTVDSGKSTLTTLIANTSINAGFKTAIIDADIGQADVGPPTFITLGLLTNQIISLSELNPHTYAFIGTTTPYSVVDRIILSIVKLLSKSLTMGSEVIIINTDGWFKGSRAVEAKFKTVLHVKPNVVFIIKKQGSHHEAEELRRALNRFNIKTIVLEAPQLIKERSLEERRNIRELTYTKYFRGSNIVELKLDELIIIGPSIFKGRILSEEEKKFVKEILSLNSSTKIAYMAFLNGSLILVLHSGTITIGLESMRKLREAYGQVRLKILHKGWEKGLIVSIIDEALDEVGVGYIEELDFHRGTMKIRTNYKGKISGLIVGNIKLMYDKESGVVKECGKWSF